MNRLNLQRHKKSSSQRWFLKSIKHSKEGKTDTEISQSRHLPLYTTEGLGGICDLKTKRSTVNAGLVTKLSKSIGSFCSPHWNPLSSTDSRVTQELVGTAEFISIFLTGNKSVQEIKKSYCFHLSSFHFFRAVFSIVYSHGIGKQASLKKPHCLFTHQLELHIRKVLSTACVLLTHVVLFLLY